MGQVFTWDAVRDGRIPKQESFHHVVKEVWSRLASEPSIVSALLFGSVVRGDFNVRSDVDCVVIYETQNEKWAMIAMHEIDQMAHALHVPINFTPCDTVLARTRLHHLGTAFVRHLQASIDAGGLIKGNLVDLIAPTTPASQEIESYIKMKMYSMQESLAQMTSFSEERQVAFLKKALEAPTHVARKMLIYESALRGDSKREVQRQYQEVMPSVLSEQFDRLISIDRLYTTDLEIQLENLNEDAYRKSLGVLKTQLPRVLEFLRSNIIRLDAAQ